MKRHFRLWQIASFRGGAVIQPLSVHSGHCRTCCWLDPGRK
jgi:hypothetical protein